MGPKLTRDGSCVEIESLHVITGKSFAPARNLWRTMTRETNISFRFKTALAITPSF
jgi:hypothetical protein